MSAVNDVVQNETRKQNEQLPSITIAKTWRQTPAQRTVVFAIPRKMAEFYDLSKPSTIYLIPKKDGIMLKKLNLENVK